MKKTMTAILCSLLLPVGVAMALSAADKKEDKKDTKKETEKGGKDKEDNKPVVVVTWEMAWPPVYGVSDPGE